MFVSSVCHLHPVLSSLALVCPHHPLLYTPPSPAGVKERGGVFTKQPLCRFSYNIGQAKFCQQDPELLGFAATKCDVRFEFRSKGGGPNRDVPPTDPASA